MRRPGRAEGAAQERSAGLAARILTHCLLLGVQRAEDALHAAELALQCPDAAVGQLDVALELLEQTARVPGHVRELP